MEEGLGLKAKVAIFTRKIIELEKNDTYEVKSLYDTIVQPTYYSICYSFEHIMEDSPSLPLEESPHGR